MAIARYSATFTTASPREQRWICLGRMKTPPATDRMLAGLHALQVRRWVSQKALGITRPERIARGLPTNTKILNHCTDSSVIRPGWLFERVTFGGRRRAPAD